MHVVGASLGAVVALLLAATHPELVRSLILVTPFLRPSGRLLAVAEAWAALAAEAEPRVLAAAVLPWMFSPEFLADERRRERALRGLAEAATRVPAQAVARQLEAMKGWAGFREKVLSSLRADVLVIGAGEDILVGDASGVAAAIPRSRYELVTGSGHAVTVEAPERVAAIVTSHAGE